MPSQKPDEKRIRRGTGIILESYWWENKAEKSVWFSIEARPSQLGASALDCLLDDVEYGRVKKLFDILDSIFSCYSKDTAKLRKKRATILEPSRYWVRWDFKLVAPEKMEETYLEMAKKVGAHPEFGPSWEGSMLRLLKGN